jgi:ribonuclease R
MTYTEVRRILVDKDSECLVRYAPLVDEFKLMEDLALLIYANRKARGNLDFDLPEAEIILDLLGLPENIVRAERNIAHRIIEEFMIAANEAVARQLAAGPKRWRPSCCASVGAHPRKRKSLRRWRFNGYWNPPAANPKSE